MLDSLISPGGPLLGKSNPPILDQPTAMQSRVCSRFLIYDTTMYQQSMNVYTYMCAS